MFTVSFYNFVDRSIKSTDFKNIKNFESVKQIVRENRGDFNPLTTRVEIHTHNKKDTKKLIEMFPDPDKDSLINADSISEVFCCNLYTSLSLIPIMMYVDCPRDDICEHIDYNFGIISVEKGDVIYNYRDGKYYYIACNPNEMYIAYNLMGLHKYMIPVFDFSQIDYRKATDIEMENQYLKKFKYLFDNYESFTDEEIYSITKEIESGDILW